MVSLEQLQSSVTNFIRAIKGRRREQRAFALAAVCFSAGYFLGSRWIPEWKEWRSLATVQLVLYAVGTLAFAYGFIRLWRATHAPDLPPPKDRPLVIKGPSAFTPSDGELFRRLGRETELQELMGYVLDNQVPLVVLMGESGAGKTSLLRAGLPHILQGRAKVHYWEAVPTDSVERLLRAIQEDWSANSATKPAKLEDLINPSAESLGAEQHVIVLDQFEQLRGRNAVLQFLRRIVRESLPPHRLTWVVAFRREYRADWADFIIPENNKRGFYPKEMSLRLFTSETARDVISQLIQEAGLQVEQPVVNNLIEAATNADSQVSPVDLGIGLLILAEWHDRLGGRTLTVKDYQFAGGAEGLLTQYINRCLERFAETEREPLLKALLALRNPETNQRLAEGLPLEKLATEAATEERRLQPQLERLAQRDIRLLETVKQDGVTHYRLPHERLIPALHRLTGKLLAEVEQVKMKFQSAFQAWQNNGKQRRYLLRSKELRLVERFETQIGECGDGQTKTDFLLLSKRRRKVIKIAAAVIGIVGVIGINWHAITYSVDSYLEDRAYNASFSKLQPQMGKLEKLQLAHSLDIEHLSCLSYASLEELTLRPSPTDSLNSLSKCSSLKRLKLDLDSRLVIWIGGLAGTFSREPLELDLAGSQIGDLEPLTKLSNLTQLTLSLRGSQVSNLEQLARLSNLTQLTLELSSDSRVSNLEPLAKLSNLQQLTLNLIDSRVSNLEPLAKLSNLQKLTLNLRSSQESKLEPLTKLSKLTQLTLNIVGSLGSSLEPLAKLSNLQQLTLNLSSSQGGNLEPLAKLRNLQQLILNLYSSQVSNLEPLAKLSNLQQLTLDLNSSQVSNLEPVAKLSNLTQLTLDLRFSQVSNLEPLRKLSNLTQLMLNLINSQVVNLEPLTKLSNQTELTISIDGTGYLEPLAKLRNLRQLILNLYSSQVSNLEPLAKLSNLQQLTLDLSSSQVSKLEPLTKLSNLTHLTLNLRLSQGSNLEPLARLSKLTQLTLNMVGGLEDNLESLAKLSNLTQLTLDLHYSEVNNLGPLAKLSNLQKLTLDLSRSEVSNLVPLAKLSNLQKLTLKLGDELGGASEVTNFEMLTYACGKKA